MFDFAWSEIALIAAVALIAIGPKDMPAAIRGVSNMVKKARKMAAEFQTHVDEMVREANLDEVKSQFNEIRNFDVRAHLEKAVDSDGSLRSTFAGNPLDSHGKTSASASTASPASDAMTSDAIEMPLLDEVTVAGPQTDAVIPPPDAMPAKPLAPAFIPPGMVSPPEVHAAVASEPEPPAFIPPIFSAPGGERQSRTSPSA